MTKCPASPTQARVLCAARSAQTKPPHWIQNPELQAPLPPAVDTRQQKADFGFVWNTAGNGGKRGRHLSIVKLGPPHTFRVGVQAGRELPLDLGSKKSLLWGSIDGWVFFKRRKNGGAGGGSKVSHESRIGVDY